MRLVHAGAVVGMLIEPRWANAKWSPGRRDVLRRLPQRARYVTEMVRRIAALVLMGPELDANYERVKADVWEWAPWLGCAQILARAQCEHGSEAFGPIRSEDVFPEVVRHRRT
jgi:hypothetical protein